MPFYFFKTGLLTVRPIGGTTSWLTGLPPATTHTLAPTTFSSRKIGYTSDCGMKKWRICQIIGYDYKFTPCCSGVCILGPLDRCSGRFKLHARIAAQKFQVIWLLNKALGLIPKTIIQKHQNNFILINCHKEIDFFWRIMIWVYM